MGTNPSTAAGEHLTSIISPEQAPVGANRPRPLSRRRASPGGRDGHLASGELAVLGGRRPVPPRSLLVHDERRRREGETSRSAAGAQRGARGGRRRRVSSCTAARAWSCAGARATRDAIRHFPGPRSTRCNPRRRTGWRHPGDARYVEVVATSIYSYAFSRERFETLVDEHARAKSERQLTSLNRGDAGR